MSVELAAETTTVPTTVTAKMTQKSRGFPLNSGTPVRGKASPKMATCHKKME